MTERNSPEIRRYPPTQNKSLRAWSAADEHILKWFDDQQIEPENILILNDRFGYLTCHFNSSSISVVADNKSQVKSTKKNLSNNKLDESRIHFLNPLEEVDKTFSFACLNIPKSLEQFRFYLQKIHGASSEETVVICGFMTRHFSPAILEIAQEYFEHVNQSLAWKKSRVLELKGRKKQVSQVEITTFEDTLPDGSNIQLKQYPGVFSLNSLDNATRFLISHLTVEANDRHILDLGSGNGVLAKVVQTQKPEADIHLMDDSYLAIESSRLNMDEGSVSYHWTDTIDDINEDLKFDLVVSNPPFHLEHEVNTEVAVELFREVAGRLNRGGRFLCVANRHLGYRPHLKKFFTQCDELASNKKFVIYSCRMNS